MYVYTMWIVLKLSLNPLDEAEIDVFLANFGICVSVQVAVDLLGLPLAAAGRPLGQGNSSAPKNT